MKLRKPILFGAGSAAGLIATVSPGWGVCLLLLVLFVGLLTEPCR